MDDVLVGYDSSPDALRALLVAAEDAAASGAGLHVLTAAPLSEVATAEALLRQAEELAVELHPRLRVTRHLHVGPPALALLAVAAGSGHPCRSIVLGARGRGQEFLPGPGSVTEAVLDGARVPVVVVGRASFRGSLPPDGPAVAVAVLTGQDTDDEVLAAARSWARRHHAVTRSVRVDRRDERWDGPDDAVRSAAAVAGIVVVAAPDDAGPVSRSVLTRCTAPVLVVPTGLSDSAAATGLRAAPTTSASSRRPGPGRSRTSRPVPRPAPTSS